MGTPDRRATRPGAVAAIERSTSRPLQVVPLPIGYVSRHQRLEELAMVGKAQVQQFMSDDEILEVRVLVGQVGGQGDNS